MPPAKRQSEYDGCLSHELRYDTGCLYCPEGTEYPDSRGYFLIGFDDMGLARVTHTPLTIVAQPLEQLGIYAAKRILSRLENPEDVPISITLSASLKPGSSIGVPRHVEDE